jgi:hypothetical protein
MKLHHLILTCAIGLFLGGCKSSTSPGPSAVTINQLFPLAVGDSWIMQAQSFDSTGKVLSDMTLPYLTIVGTQQFRGQQAYQALLSISTDTLLFFISGTDLFQVSKYNSANPIVGQYFRYPMNVGESLSLGDSTNLILRSTNEAVTVLAKPYSAYHYDETVVSGKAPYDTLELSQRYFVPNVGMVLDKEYSRDGKGLYMSLQLSLSSYTVK